VCLVTWMPTGMLDWPGRMAATVFLAGCNLRCPFCHNPTLVHPASPAPVYESFLEYLRARRTWLDGVVITGGEPTTDTALPAFLDDLSTLRIPAKLDTNGTRPQVVSSVVEAGLVAFVALDVKAAPERYAEACGGADVWPSVAESIRILLARDVAHEFRTTVFPGAVDLEDLVDIARSISGGDRYVLQQYRPGKTLSPAAASVKPYSRDQLFEIAEECSAYISTVVRGA